MKIHLSLIPSSGLERPLRLPLDTMARLAETMGAQSGEVAADLILKNRDGNVEITGRLQARLQPPCQRCLEPVPLELDEPLRVALVPQQAYEEAPGDFHLDAGDLEVSFYDGEELDLAHIVEDELLLLIPELIVEEDADGCCGHCGKRLDELMPLDPEQGEEHPFAKMKALLEGD